MYNLYSDKGKIFECNINIEGASLDNAIARIVIESSDMNLMFNGSIDKDGVCKIPIKKLKNILPEGFTGAMKLEVIADDTYFCPWSSECDVKASKSIQVEVKQEDVIKEQKPKLTVTEIVKEKEIKKSGFVKSKLNEKNQKYLKSLSTLFKEKGITEQMLITNKTVLQIVKNFMIESNIEDKKIFVNELRQSLKDVK